MEEDVGKLEPSYIAEGNVEWCSQVGKSFGSSSKRWVDFSDSSLGKESTCNAGDPGSIPGSGRSTEEGIGYALQYSWVSLLAQLVKNLPVVWESWVWSLGWEDPLERGKDTHSSILAWRIPWTPKSMGLQRIRYDWATFAFKKLNRVLIWPSNSISRYTHVRVGNICPHRYLYGYIQSNIIHNSPNVHWQTNE